MLNKNLIKYAQLTADTVYRNMSVQELELVIGNYLQIKSYDRLAGKNAAEKAANLHAFFLQEKTENEIQVKIKTSDYETRRRKLLYYIPNECINKNRKLVDIPVEYLKMKIKGDIINGKLSLYITSFTDLKTSYQAKLKEFINLGYSIIISHDKQKHILIYNS